MPTFTKRFSSLAEASAAQTETLAAAEKEAGVPMKISSTTCTPVGEEYDVSFVVEPA